MVLQPSMTARGRIVSGVRAASQLLRFQASDEVGDAATRGFWSMGTLVRSAPCVREHCASPIRAASIDFECDVIPWNLPSL